MPPAASSSTLPLGSPFLASLLAEPPIVPFPPHEAQPERRGVRDQVEVDQLEVGIPAQLGRDEAYDYQAAAMAASLGQKYTTPAANPHPLTILSSTLASPLPTSRQQIFSTPTATSITL